MPHLLYKSIQITSPFLIYHPYCLTFLVNPSRIPHPVIWQAHSFRGKILVKRLDSILIRMYEFLYINLYMYLCTGQAFRLEKLLPILRMNLVLLWLAFLGFIQNQEQYNDINPIIHCWGLRVSWYGIQTRETVLEYFIVAAVRWVVEAQVDGRRRNLHR
jgi:hypothetical protein